MTARTVVCRLTPTVPAMVAGALLLTACAGQENGAFDTRGSVARDLGRLFWVMTGLGTAVFVLVVWLAFASRRGSDEQESEEVRQRRSSRLVLGGGVVLPMVVLIPLVVYMLIIADRVTPRVGEAYEIRVVGHLFWWHVEYPDAGVVTANEIHVPTGTRVRMVMETADVIHSFWPPQLSGKIDMIPGQVTELTFDVDEPGVHLGQCAEFCGVQHARMRFLVVAQEPDQFETWLEAQAAPAPPPATEGAERGAQLFHDLGCASCHRIRGNEAEGAGGAGSPAGAGGETAGAGGSLGSPAPEPETVIGPDLTHLASRATLGAGTVANDRGQLGGWIANPHAVKPGNLMPPTPMTGDQLIDLLDYLQGLE